MVPAEAGGATKLAVQPDIQQDCKEPSPAEPLSPACRFTLFVIRSALSFLIASWQDRQVHFVSKVRATNFHLDVIRLIDIDAVAGGAGH